MTRVDRILAFFFRDTIFRGARYWYKLGYADGCRDAREVLRSG
jgi:hypothetical protein